MNLNQASSDFSNSNNSNALFKKKNTIWSDALIENNLCDDIGKFSSLNNDDENNKLIKVKNRDVESYTYSVDQTKESKTITNRNHLFLSKPQFLDNKNFKNKIQAAPEETNLDNRHFIFFYFISNFFLLLNKNH